MDVRPAEKLGIIRRNLDSQAGRVATAGSGSPKVTPYGRFCMSSRSTGVHVDQIESKPRFLNLNMRRRIAIAR